MTGSKESALNGRQRVQGSNVRCPSLRVLVFDIWERLHFRVPILLGLSALNGLLEGIGVLLLLPLLGSIGIGNAHTSIPLVGNVGVRLLEIGVEPTVGSVLGVVVGVFLIQYIVFVSYSRVAARLQFRYEALWRRDLFSSYLRAEWNFFARCRSGELVNTLVGEANRVCGAFEMFVQVSSAILVVFIYVGLAAATSWPITIYLLLVGAVLFSITRKLVYRGHQIGTDISRWMHALQSHANEILGGAKLIKATSTEEVAGERLSVIVDSIQTAYFHSYFHRSLLRGIFEFGAIVALCVMLAVGSGEFGYGCGTNSSGPCIVSPAISPSFQYSTTVAGAECLPSGHQDDDKRAGCCSGHARGNRRSSASSRFGGRSGSLGYPRLAGGLWGTEDSRWCKPVAARWNDDRYRRPFGKREIYPSGLHPRIGSAAIRQNHLQWHRARDFAASRLASFDRLCGARHLFVSCFDSGQPALGTGSGRFRRYDGGG